ncbi:hypothetical protein TNCV_4899741 [Trichonephila clavipes]|nr:hypothetical protein TNCV_4899741 [Trichonephila clavipes]
MRNTVTAEINKYLQELEEGLAIDFNCKPLPGFSQSELGQKKRTIRAEHECSSGTGKIYNVQSVFAE